MGWWGSSPRGRGKLSLKHGRRRLDRLIPARAGKTGVRCFRSFRSSAHPRAGGENRLHIVRPLSSVGSSPRGRGKRVGGETDCSALGLIPARAGKTASNRLSQISAGAHPRAGGENPTGPPRPASKPRLIPARAGKTMGFGTPRSRSAGSSPRGRGKQGEGSACCPELRLIPARAGKTRSTPAPGTGTRAHPRAGGENPPQGSVSR